MRLYFAGGEAWGDLLLDMGVKNLLMSYFYFRDSMRGKGQKMRQLLARMRRAKAKGYSFILDSGAFTYQVKEGTAANTPPEEYFEEYLDFCRDFGDVFDIIAEFDVEGAKRADGSLVKITEVDRWTNRMLSVEGIRSKIMPVYHPHRGQGWLKGWLLDTYSPFVGVGSDTSKGVPATIATAHRHGKWVHGFGITRVKTDMKWMNFDSVDSTTWLRADKYGGTCVFLKDKFIVLDHKHKKDRIRYKDHFEAWGLDWGKIWEDDLKEMRLATIIAWRELANYYERQGHIRNQGRYPYLYELEQAGQRVTEHPLITKAKKKHT